VLVPLWYITPLVVFHWFPRDHLFARSAIGQTFTISASLFSSIALVALVVTLIGQRRELAGQKATLVETRKDIQRSSEAMFRNLHMQLLSIAFGDPDLLDVWKYDSDPPGDDAPVSLKRELYANLVISHVQSSYLAGLASDETLRAMLQEIFESVEIRDYWTRVARLRTVGDIGDDRVLLARFVSIANDELAKRPIVEH
jgi:hypothetical protein